ncbi:hypothetical protein HPB47_028444 [Ixodes persulcatus]|uniref:Uncharacterized protein n=1 Tax=Ixodes persulcatus TaxID=34615 RepID=A0AC60PT98_IXOPE|nr:hypothetical protein HPB47_028444 [Ixodes persulcatus]
MGAKSAILKELSAGAKNGDLCKKYGLSKCNISTIAKDKETIMAAMSMNGDCSARKRLRHAPYKDVEDALFKWFLDARTMNVPISVSLLLGNARDFAFLLNFAEFSPGNGWLYRFKERHGIVYKSIVGEVASVDIERAEQWLADNLDEIYSNRPQLTISLMNAVEMQKASWMEVRSGSIKNCFRKTGISLSSTGASQDDAQSIDSIRWTQVVAASLTEEGQTWDDFVHADEDVIVSESASDEAIMREVRPTFQDIAASDDEDDVGDWVAPSRSVSTMTALGHIASLKQLVYARGLSDVHIDQLSNLESAMIGSALRKQTTITDFLQ